MIKAIIFDMDGVLIDAKEWHYKALNKSLELFGFTIDPAEHRNVYDGLPTAEKLRILTRNKGLPEKLHSKINDLKQLYTLEQIATHCEPRLIHHNALSQLVRRGLILAVASNSIRATVDLMMQKSDLQKYLSLTLSNQDVLFPKPEPEIYLKAMTILNISPSDCLIVEDNEHGVTAAKASGAHVMIVDNTNDVNIEALTSFISDIEKKSKI